MLGLSPAKKAAAYSTDVNIQREVENHFCPLATPLSSRGGMYNVRDVIGIISDIDVYRAGRVNDSRDCT